MFRNYLKIAFRGLRRHPFFAFTNVFGLALGFACCILILLFVFDEWSYDGFHQKADRIYRVALYEQYEDHEFLNTVTPFRFASMMQDNIPDVEAAVRIGVLEDMVRIGDQSLSERIHMVDPGFFQMFDFPLLEGSAAQVLNQPGAVVLTEDAVQRFFGEDDPMGKTLSILVRDEYRDFIVSGIAANPPSNSSIQFDVLISLSIATDLYSERARQSLFNVYVETYLQVVNDPAFDSADLDAKMPDLIRQVMGEDYVEGAYVPRFQKLTDIHLDTDYPVGIEPISDPRYSYILSVIALMVLLIACINFMTLSLGRSADRAREVGVRKVVGAVRAQLVGQFWGEAVLLCLLGLGVGVLITEMALPAFNVLSGKELILAMQPKVIGALVGLTLLVGLIAGSYPALFLSKFQPIEVFKGRFRMGDAGRFRRTLTVVQFALAIILMSCTFITGDQLRFLQEKNLGFDREQVISLKTGMSWEEGIQLAERFKSEMEQNPGIDGVGVSLYAFGEPWISAGYEDDNGVYRQFMLNIIDEDFLQNMRITPAEGRLFSEDVSADVREGLIVNRAFVEAHGWDQGVGRQLPRAAFPPHRIIGVVDDFNFESLHSDVRPLALIMDRGVLMPGLNDVGTSAPPQPKIAVRIRSGQIQAMIREIETVWKSIAPAVPFDYTFLDDALEQQYRQEQRLGTIVQYATILVMLIACLGLLGLAALVVMKRTKEIGVRKVMGATVSGIVFMLSRDFVRLVGLAFVPAVPVAYYSMTIWLQDFAYAVNVSWLTFAGAGVSVLVVAWLTVSYHSFKAARANPVDALRYE